MKQYLSPGVYTQVYDRSFLLSAPPAGPAAIFVGPFSKGRALIPMNIKDSNDLINKMGLPNGLLYTPYAAYLYSKQKGDFYVQRILWNEGWKTDAYAIYGYTSDNPTGSILSLLMPTAVDGVLATSSVTIATKNGDNWSNLEVTVEGNGLTSSYTMRVNDILNIDLIIKTTPYQKKPWYVFANITDYTDSTQLTEAGFDSIGITKLEDFYSSSNGYSSAKTPWIYNENDLALFYFNHLSDGTYTNKDVKIAILNINTSSTLEQTLFDVIVRKYNDIDKYPLILETFYLVNLNPTSNRYIAKVIGDGYVSYNESSKKIIINGDYKNNSNYIRVVVSDLVKNLDVNLHSNVNKVGRIPFIGGTTTDIITDSYPAVYTDSDEELPDDITHYGYNTSLNSIKYLSNPIPGDGFTVSGVTDAIDNMGTESNYIVPFYGGFDGRNPSMGFETNTSSLNGFDFTDAESNGYKSYKTAVDLLKNVLLFNIDIISIPGLNLGDTGKSSFYKYVLLNIAEYRTDVLVPVDAGTHNLNNVGKVLKNTLDFDSSYGAAYFPLVKINCPFTRKIPIIPAATYIPAVIAYTANVSQPHYAPAGINRGVLDVLQPMIKLNKQDRDNLYKNRINPIVSFVNNGTVVWGQKTLQKADSALDRVNVRILINNIIKWVNDYGKRVLFENNTTTLRTVFTIGMLRYLNGIVAANGLYAYKFVMDLTNNTADVIDRNQLVGLLYVKPSKTLLFIIIPINILRSDAEL